VIQIAERLVDSKIKAENQHLLSMRTMCQRLHLQLLFKVAFASVCTSVVCKCGVCCYNSVCLCDTVPCQNSWVHHHTVFHFMIVLSF